MSPATSLPCPWTCLFPQEHRVLKRDLNGWLLVLAGQGPPTAGHCISLLRLTGTDGSLYILSSHIFCTNYCLTVSAGFLLFLHFWSIYILSLEGFWFSTTPWIIPSFFFPSSLFCTLLSFRGTRHFKNSLLHKKKNKKNNPSGFSPKQSTVFLSCLLLFAGG